MANSSFSYVFLAAFCLFVTSVSSQTPNVTVALDGTGDFSSIGAAIKAAPNNSNTFYCIYVKKGIYYENVNVDPEKTHIVIFGDGINNTIINSNRSSAAGFDTQSTATMNITTDWFLAKDMSIVNSAGAQAGQAVALRVAGDYISCYRCAIEGYQDTLFTAYGKQFFYECQIYGTVDFIFGDSAVVLQKTFIYVRKPMKRQKNVITADGRESAAKNTATVIHNCTISGASEFMPTKSTIQTYLGRPWKTYSRTVIMESYLDDLIDRKGWYEYNGTFALSTLYYAEYANHGPGASTKGRVNWPGHHSTGNPNEVQNFTVQNFIHGNEWLPQLKVPFIPNLVS